MKDSIFSEIFNLNLAADTGAISIASTALPNNLLSFFINYISCIFKDIFMTSFTEIRTISFWLVVKFFLQQSLSLYPKKFVFNRIRLISFFRIQLMTNFAFSKTFKIPLRKHMPINAMSLFCINGSRANSSESIFFISHGFKMFRINAKSIAAKMINSKIFWNISFYQFIGNSMSDISGLTFIHFAPKVLYIHKVSHGNLAQAGKDGQ